MAHDVFISYSNMDKTVADAVCAGLEKEGIRCWIAPRDILPSENYDDAIIRAISSARVMVVIFSSNIFQSQFVKSELERGFSKGLIIAPFRIENVAPEGGLELYLGRRHWLDAITPPLEAHIKKLASTIQSILVDPNNQPEENLNQFEPDSSKKRLAFHLSKTTAFIASLGAVLVILMLVFILIKNPPNIVNTPINNTPTSQMRDLQAPTASPYPAVLSTEIRISATVTASSSSTPTVITTTGSTEITPLPGSWKQITDLPRSVNAIVIDPNDPNIIYAAVGVSNQGGVYKSEDAGLTWHDNSKGLPNLPVIALCIVVDNGPVVLASTENNSVFSSRDGGETWVSLEFPGGAGDDIYGFASFGDLKSTLAMVSTRGLMRTDNGGRNWIHLGEGLPASSGNTSPLLASIALDPSDSKIVYVGTGGGGLGQGMGVYKSTDGGQTFSPSNRGMLDYGITSLAVDPRQPQIIYAGCWDGNLFKSEDGGQTWTNLEAQLKPTEDGNILHQIRDIQIDPNNGVIYILTDFSGIIYSQNNGSEWRLLGVPSGLKDRLFSSMTVISGEKPMIYLSTFGQGTWKFNIE